MEGSCRHIYSSMHSVTMVIYEDMQNYVSDIVDCAQEFIEVCW